LTFFFIPTSFRAGLVSWPAAEFQNLSMATFQARGFRAKHPAPRLGQAAEEGKDAWNGLGLPQAVVACSPAYISEPGVVSVCPVSSSVFRPERIIGQPP